MSFTRKSISFIFSFFCGTAVFAQSLQPVTRFHAKQSPYIYYSDEFLSGFKQTAASNSQSGFLQMPFVGDPLLVYVGEKDSTQYMAYASGYKFQQRQPETGDYKVELTRYGIQAQIKAHPAYAIHEYVFPDTVADKGFLIDIDNADCGTCNQDMDIYLIDKRTIRAYKRPSLVGSQEPGLYYYARFSHPLKTWNIRRERVTLEDNSKETRLKAAFTFDIQGSEKLTVASAVSSVSSDKAYAQLEGHMPKAHFNDRPVSYYTGKRDLAARTGKSAARRPKQEAAAPERVPLKHSESILPPAPKGPVDYIEITTREADLRAAFYSAVSVLKNQPACAKVKTADEFFKAVTPLYQQSRNARATVAATDSLLHAYAKNMFAGGAGQSADAVQAAWYVFNAIGFRPAATADSYEFVRPLFNITKLQLSQGRRLLIHAKNNSARNTRIAGVTLWRQPLPEGNILTHEQLKRGGIIAVQMQRP